MAYQYSSTFTHQTMNGSIKRRMEEDETIVISDNKRYFDLNTQFSPAQPQKENLPSITFASPDYRPPPPSSVPLWLQPVPTVTEDDSEDDALLTPAFYSQQEKKEYWGENMVIDQH